MNLAFLYLSASISFALAVWPPTIDPRLLQITEMKIKVQAELDLTDVCGEIKTWLSNTLDIIPEFIATANQTRLLIKEEPILQILEDIKKVAEGEIKEPVKADMEKDAKADMEKAAEGGTKKTTKIDNDSVAEQVMSYIGRIEFSVVVEHSTNGDPINTMPKITFQKMYLPTRIYFYYFKLPKNIKIEDGEKLNFHYENAHEGIKVTNVLKGREEQVQVCRNPLEYNEITFQDKPLSLVDGLTGPYCSCGVLLTKNETQNLL